MDKKKRGEAVRFLFHFKSIRNSMLFSFTLVVVLALLIFLLFSLNYTEETVLDNSKDYTKQLVEQVNSNIDSYISYMESISQMVTDHSDVVDYLFGDGSTGESLKLRLLEQFKTVLDTREDIYNIAVIADNGKMVLNRGVATLNPSGDIPNKPWYLNTIKANGAAVVSGSHVQNAFKDKYQWVVTLSKGLINPATNKIEGIFFIDLNYSAIKSLCEKIELGNKGYMFILDKDGSIIYHPQQQLLNSGLKVEAIDRVLAQENGSFITDEGNGSKLYTVRTSRETGWTIAGVSYIGELIKNKDEMQIFYLVIASGLFALAMILAVVLSKEITKPIKDLKDSMKEVERGNFQNAAFVSKGENEVASLGKSFNIMTGKIQNLMEENVREQKEKRKSELKVLQSQINPHFLYNTLDSIIWMSEGGKNREVVQMTSSLAKLLRQSISNEDEIVTIAKELGYTREYLTIQKMRYRDQLEFEIDVPARIQRKSIVKLVIQPIVENAIYHGIKYKETKGMIYITGEMTKEKIILCIRDNGVGMEQEVLDHVLENKRPDEVSNKVGVYNVHNRLQLYYGKEYGLAYESTPGIGTSVYVTIPNDEMEEDAYDEE